MKEFNMKLRMSGVNRFLYWCWNYQYTNKPYRYVIRGQQMEDYLPKFLVAVDWTCSRDHMIQKWINANVNGDTDIQIIRFYKELDGENRVRFIEYVMENYSDERKLSFEDEEE